MTHRIASLLTIALLLASSAHAQGHWQSFSFSTDPQNVPKLVSAIDEFMGTDAGKAMPGTLSLMVSVIDGGNPATHSVITSMDSMAEREAWNAKLQGNADWQALLDVFVANSERVGTSRMNFQKSWGESGDGDVAWHLFVLNVSDSAAYLKALDELMASDTGKQFPGALWLSSVAAAGMGTSTHVVSVGYESEAEAEAWNQTMLPSSDWAAFDEATGKVSTLQGSFVLRTLKTWGTATQAE